MGFEPFVFPKRESKQEPVSRDDRVATLAKTLFERKLASSMGQARMLAEGMVDVERKMLKPKKEEPAPVPVQKQESRLPDDFGQFVARAAAIVHETEEKELPVVESKPMQFGRDMEHKLAEVPHFDAHNQVMFEDAPDLTKARGYTGPKQQNVEYESQREAVRVSTGDIGVKVARAEVTPTTEVTEERMIVKVSETQAQVAETPAAPEAVSEVTSEPATPAEHVDSAQPSAQELLDEELKNAPEQTVELPRSERKQHEDPAKTHGVDLFNMFKVNK